MKPPSSTLLTSGTIIIPPHAYIAMLGFYTSIVHCNKRYEWDLKSLNRGLGWKMPRRLEYGKALTEYYAGIFTIATLI